MAFDLTRRKAMRGMAGGMAVTIGLPLLDAFLDGKGEALAATGEPLPLRFGTWFWGLGANPGRWFPDRVGPDYDLKSELEPIRAVKHKVSVLGNFAVPLDGAPNLPHVSGSVAMRTGAAPTSYHGLPGESFDLAIADRIGADRPFRSLSAAASGDPRGPLSGMGGEDIASAEASPAALYARLFGPGTGRGAKGMARRSVLSTVTEERRALERALGAADRRRLDEHFTLLREVEGRLDPDAGPGPRSADIDTAARRHAVMADLLVLALATDRTRVFDMTFSGGDSPLTRDGGSITHHQLTHEEAPDPLGHQPGASYFVTRAMESWAYLVAALDKVKEGDRTLLDSAMVVAHSETGVAKLHSVDNIPVMIAGRAGGRLKGGVHVDGAGTPVSRIGLTAQRIMGVPLERWGAGSLETDRTIGDILA